MLQLEEHRITEFEKMQAAAAMVAQATNTGSSSSTAPSTVPSATHLQATAAFITDTIPSAPRS
jgi:hypothetical protein